MALAMVDGEPGGDGVAGLLSRLDAALGAVAAVPFAKLVLAEQAAVVDGLVRFRSRLEAVEAAAVAAFDAGGEWRLDGHRTAAAALTVRSRLSRAEARRRVRLARRLRTTHAVAAALAAGEITGEHAELLTAARKAKVAAEFDRDEADLVGHARVLPPEDLGKVLRYWSDQVDPTGADERVEAVEQRARAFVSRTIDGMVRVDAWLEPIGGAAFMTAVEQLEDEFFRADWGEAEAVHGADTTLAHLARTAAQRRAAAIVELGIRATAVPADAKRPQPLVNIVMDATTFEAALRRRVGPTPNPAPPGGTPVQCETLDGVVLTPAQAIEVALAGHVRRIVYDTPNLISQVSPRRRLYTGVLRDLLEVRDRGCTHPGCDQPAWRCEADHITPYDRRVGNTTAANGRLLCRYHHRLRQRLEHPPFATRAPDGTLTHHRAEGTPIDPRPPPAPDNPG